MILNVEPGGCRPENATPGSARISPVRGRTTATPPSRSPLATTAARWTSGSIEVRTAGAGRARRLASGRPPAARAPPGGGGAGAPAAERAPAGLQDAARPAHQALVEDPLQPRGADPRIRGIA